MGSSDFETSIVRFSEEKDKKKKDVISVEVLDESSVSFTGGMDLNIELVHLVAEKFDAQKARQGKASVLSSPRAIRTLFKEVDKVKEVLSSNKEMPLRIPELFEYVDLKTTITREEFERRFSGRKDF